VPAAKGWQTVMQ